MPKTTPKTTTQKSIAQIKKYYQQNHVASGYDDRRFHGVGGQYINDTERALVHQGFPRTTRPATTPVLDLGAGRGRLSLYLAEKGYPVTCLDASSAMTHYLRSFFSPKDIILQSVFKPLTTKKTFAVITSLRFFDHFSLTDQSRIIGSTLPSLSPQGVFVYAPLNAHSAEALLGKLFAYGRYNYYYSDAEYRALFTEHGLSVVRRDSAFFIPRGVFLAVSAVPFLVSLLTSLNTLLLKCAPSWGALYVYTLKRV